jgi:hypothetical protein
MKKIATIFILSLLQVTVYAQCVMCRAMVDSGKTLDDGSNIAEGLNNGILYLMAIPYVLLSTLMLVFFRHKVKAFLGLSK